MSKYNTSELNKFSKHESRQNELFSLWAQYLLLMRIAPIEEIRVLAFTCD